MAGRRHHPRSRRRSFGPRGHAMAERSPRYPRPRDPWDALEQNAALEAADLEAEREMRDAQDAHERWLASEGADHLYGSGA